MLTRVELEEQTCNTLDVQSMTLEAKELNLGIVSKAKRSVK